MTVLKAQDLLCTKQMVLGEYLCHPSKGLFIFDVKGNVAHVLINTVDKNKNKYTVKQYSDAHKSRLLQDIIGDLAWWIMSNM